MFTTCAVITAGCWGFSSMPAVSLGSLHPLPACQGNDVAEVDDAGEAGREDRAGVGVDLGEADGSPSGALKPKVQSPGSAEEGGVGESIHRTAPDPANRTASTAP